MGLGVVSLNNCSQLVENSFVTCEGEFERLERLRLDLDLIEKG